MKGPLDRTKVVMRHLPPTISQSALMDQLDGCFNGFYNWVSFRPGKSSQKCQSYSRAYIDFKRPEDVIEFAEFFDGHVFVNEKGAQFKTIVEYAPSQRVPKQWSKMDGREGTLFKDPEYLEFLEILSKPVENLPSAEIQLEKKEAERAGAAKDTLIVTPLMDFIRQKRAAKNGSRRSFSHGKPTRRASGSSSGSPGSASSKRDKRRISTTMYVLRDSAKSSTIKDKSAYILVHKREDQQLLDHPVPDAASGTNGLEVEIGGSGTTDVGKKKILLLKGKEKEIPVLSGSLLPQLGAASTVKPSAGSAAVKQNQRHEGHTRIIKRILLNKDSHQNLSPTAQSEKAQTLSLQNDKRPPRPPTVQLYPKDINDGTQEDKVAGNELRGERLEKRTRNKDRPDRGVWTPLRRSDGPYASDDSFASLTSLSSQLVLDSVEDVTHAESKNDLLGARSGVYKPIGSGRSSHCFVDNGSYKLVGRRGPSSQNLKHTDGFSIVNEGKALKRGGSSGQSSHEKQVWVQKSSSGS